MNLPLMFKWISKLNLSLAAVVEAKIILAILVKLAKKKILIDLNKVLRIKKTAE